MPTLSIRISDRELDQLKAYADRDGVSLSRMVREMLGFEKDRGEALEELERRLSRLEGMAGL